MRAGRTIITTSAALCLVAASAGSVAAQAEPAAPVEFTASWEFGPQVSSESTEVVDGVVAMRGGAWQPAIVETSDERLDGRLTITVNHDIHGGVGGPEVWLGAFRIENDDGAWQEIPSFALTFPDGSGSGTTSILMGEGAYEGLYAIADVTLTGSMWDVHGYILEGDPPPDPLALSQD